MFSFFKKKADNDAVPEWAEFFDSNEYALFIKEVDEYFISSGVQHQLRDGFISVEGNDFGFGNFGLTNVAQICKQEGILYYKDVIAEHFNAMIRVKKFEKEFAKIADNFDEVKRYIGVRLYHHDHMVHIGQENIIAKGLAGDVYAILVFDFPDSILNIKPEQTEAWNKNVDELFEVGISNIKANYPLEIEEESLGEFSVYFVQGEHFFTPNVVFDIENRKELKGSKGSLVGLPHRHAAIIYPIESSEVLKAIHGLIPTIYGMNQEGPGSLSNQLFWYYDETFTQLPYKIEDGELRFSPPENFVRLLNELK